ncbi:MAG: DUF4214 domain-containing protein [Pseudomonadota bacterium]
MDGTSFPDMLRADSSGATLVGYGGDDRLVGGPGSDVLLGGDDADVIMGDGIVAAHLQSEADIVFRLYRATLDRDPDAVGHAAWAARMFSGERTLLEVVEGFINSPEFKRDYGDLDNQDFVNMLYRNVLDRSADQSGLARWIDELTTGATRAEVVLGFSESEEFKAATQTDAARAAQSTDPAEWADDVFRLYRATLDREPDGSGFVRWATDLASDQSLVDVAEGFLQSPEFIRDYGDKDNQDFVDLLYENVLGRQADPAGLARWVGDLEAGASRAEVVVGFVNSPEFISATAEDMIGWFRSLTGQDAVGADTISGGVGDDTLSGGLGADTFQFAPDEPGADVVLDLEIWDRLDFRAFDTGSEGAAWVLDRLSQTDDDVVFDDGTLVVTFVGKNLADIEPDMILV